MDLGQRFFWCIALSATLLAPATGSAAPQLPQRTMSHLGVLNGTCTNFIIVGIHLKGGCTGKVVDTEWGDGRVSFTYTSKLPGLVLTFSGNGNREIHEGRDAVELPVDVLFVNINGHENTVSAVGACYFRNPYDGPAPILCHASTSRGNFAAHFVSNGSSPDWMHIK